MYLCVQSDGTPHLSAKIIQESSLPHFELFTQTPEAIAADRHDSKLVAPLSAECPAISNNKNWRAGAACSKLQVPGLQTSRTPEPDC